MGVLSTHRDPPTPSTVERITAEFIAKWMVGPVHGYALPHRRKKDICIRLLRSHYTAAMEEDFRNIMRFII